MVTGNSNPTRFVAIVVVVAAIAWGAYTWWPSEERRIRKRLAALADTVNDSPGDGLQFVAHTARLTMFFEPDVVFDLGGGAAPISGREQIIALASRAQGQRGGYRIAFVDVSVTVSGATASSHLTATVEWHEANAQPTVDAREATLEWRKSDQWRIARITAVTPMEKPY